MTTLRIRLFGKFQAELDGRVLKDLDALKVQELFCYLLLYRDRPHHREALSGLLWGDSETAQSRKYLRQALWQLQLALNSGPDKLQSGPVAIDSDWVSITPSLNFWLDVQVFDEALLLARGIPGQALDLARAQALKNAAQLYCGDLLEGCYQDWCLYERERLQNAYLDLLDKLMEYAETRAEYEEGLEYGAKILRCDHARERTHYRLMRLYYLANDRAGALRQYQRCVAALDQELGVKPSQRTINLCEQIQADRVAVIAGTVDTSSGPATHPESVSYLLDHLKTLRAKLAGLQYQVDQELRALEDALGHLP